MLLFGSIAFGDSLDEHANFRSFPSAMLTLFRVAVGDDWVGLMEVGDVTGGCGWGS